MSKTVSAIYTSGSMYRLRGRRNDGATYTRRQSISPAQDSEVIVTPKREKLEAQLNDTLRSARKNDARINKLRRLIAEFQKLSHNEKVSYRQEHEAYQGELEACVKRQAALANQRDQQIAKHNKITSAHAELNANAVKPEQKGEYGNLADQSSVSSSSDETHNLLQVPIPAERMQALGTPYATRDGQSEFRDMVLEAYGGCAVTGCKDEAVLQAAHIIPYVDARSHLIANGICLRADLHLLFDRGLLAVAADYTIAVSPDVGCDDYRVLHGRKLLLPGDESDWPNPHLLSIRGDYI